MNCAQTRLFLAIALATTLAGTPALAGEGPIELLPNPTPKGTNGNVERTYDLDANNDVVAITSYYTARHSGPDWYEHYRSGIVHVFRDSGTTHVLEAVLFPAGDFDYSPSIYTTPFVTVALGSNILAMGIIDDESPMGVIGQVQIYARLGDRWVQTATLEGPAETMFGFEVEFAGDDLLVHDGVGDGVFVYRQDGAEWIQVDLLRPGGLSPDVMIRPTIAASDQSIALVSEGEQGARAVHAYQFENGEWTLQQTIAPPAEAGAEFGAAVAVNDDLLVIGDPLAVPGGESMLHVFRRSSNGQWVSESQLMSPFAKPIGDWVDVTEDAIVATRPGSAVFAHYWFDGKEWRDGFQYACTGLQCARGPIRLGSLAALDGEKLVVTADLWLSEANYIAAIGSTKPSAQDDCNNNMFSDSFEIAFDERIERNGNGVPDDCEPGLDFDCNGNGVCDSTDIAKWTSTDCNENGVPDECESETDADGDGVADICDNCPALGNPEQIDCDKDGVGDACSIANGLSADCNGDGVPDECTATYPDVPVGVVTGYWYLPNADGALLSMQPFTIRPGGEVITGVSIIWSTSSQREARLLIVRDPNQNDNYNEFEVVRDRTVQTGDYNAQQEVFFLSDPWVTYDVEPTYVGEAGETFYVAAMTIDHNFPAGVSGETQNASDAGLFSFHYPPVDGLHLLNPISDLTELSLGVNTRWTIRAVTEPVSCQCTADIAGSASPDADDVVDEHDLMALLTEWGECGEPCPPQCAADLTGNCRVDVRDLLVLLAQWGVCQP